MSKKYKGTTSGSSSKLQNYLSISFEFDETEASSTSFAILDLWKRHSNQYPILAMIAKQVLATLCSTVVVEQAFSAGRNILDETHSRLAPYSLEAKAYVDDWTKAQYRQQEMDRKAEIDFFDNDRDISATGTGSDE